LDKLIAYVKDKRGNLSTIVRALSYVVSRVPLKLVGLWQGFCFGHAFSKTCQYTCNDATICVGLSRGQLENHTISLAKNNYVDEEV
jgi:hypothetical protein